MTAMRHRIRVFIGGAFIAGVAVTLLSHFTAPPVLDQRNRAVAPVPAAGSPASVAAEPQRPVRDVTPQGVARVYMPPPQAGDKRNTVASSIRIDHAGVTPNGSISGEGGTVRLYGVALPEAKKICAAASGESWPCGRRAYITLHNKVVSHTVNCEPRGSDPPTADCFVEGVNLAAWLLGQGLAHLAADVTDKELIAAEAAARKAKLGLWSDPGETATAVRGP